jgi:methylamine dehydrogenase accessory protein MauD
VTDALLISNVLLWALVLVLVLVVLALTRQVGILHERIAPAGALAVTSGPAVGDAAPRLVLEREGGGRVEIGGPDANGLRTLLFFLSPTCPVCKTLLPTIHRLVESESPGLRIV